MLDPRRAVRKRGTTGAKLPQPYTALAQLGVYLRRGWTSLLVAAPGGGKSTLALNWADDCGAPALYVSIDTDRVTMSARLAAKRMGQEVSTVESAVDTPEVTAALARGHLTFGSDGNYDVQAIVDEVRAYVEIYGQFPEFLVVDNLVDVDGKGDSEWLRMRGVVDALNVLARESGMHVMILAHATGQYEDGGPIPLSGLEFKVGKNVGLVMTMDRPSAQVFNIRVVKHRSGRADAAGHLYAQLFVDLPRMSVFDMPDDRWKIPGRAIAQAHV
jgi:predicted ATP-dependent serine protease